MKIGVVKEIKTHEYRVSLTPAGVETLIGDGHTVEVEASAGVGSGLEDEQYRAAGAVIVPAAADIWASADMILRALCWSRSSTRSSRRRWTSLRASLRT